MSKNIRFFGGWCDVSGSLISGSLMLLTHKDGKGAFSHTIKPGGCFMRLIRQRLLRQPLALHEAVDSRITCHVSFILHRIIFLAARPTMDPVVDIVAIYGCYIWLPSTAHHMSLLAASIYSSLHRLVSLLSKALTAFSASLSFINTEECSTPL